MDKISWVRLSYTRKSWTPKVPRLDKGTRKKQPDTSTRKNQIEESWIR